MYLFHLYCRLEFWMIRKLWLIKFWSVWERTTIKYGLYWDTNNIDIWSYVYIWENCNLWWLWWIEIWDGTIIASNVIIRSSNHDYKSNDYIPYWPGIDERKVKIWKNCWIWSNVLIAPGVHLWEGSIVWFWAVLSGEYPQCSIIVGNPAKVIKQRDVRSYKILKENEKIYLKCFNS